MRGLVAAIYLASLGAALAEPRDPVHPPTTMYHRTDTSLTFGGIGNPTRISVAPVEDGYQVRIRNTMTPMDFNETAFRFGVPGGEVIVHYTVGISWEPDHVFVEVPDGWIAIPYDTIMEEDTTSFVLVTPYTGG